METLIIRRLEKLIAARAGLQIREQELPLLQKTLEARLQALKIADAEDYLRLLTTAGATSAAEWKQLFVLLTNQESYFFRDRGQLSVVRNHILPELIRANSSRRSLRVWSAGCSTGEEPYSLAIMLDEVLPLRDGWEVQIFGTDLSEAALERARRGIYGSWSFRNVDASVQARYFRARAGKWEIEPRLREVVCFQMGNLLDDEFPSQASGLHDIDLIICRNVFIYFQREAVSRVLRKFRATLRNQGCLVTGHAELHSISVTGFQQRAFTQTVVYQRLDYDINPVQPNTQAVIRRRATPITPSVESRDSVAPDAPLPTKKTMIGSTIRPVGARPTLIIPTANVSPDKVLSRPPAETSKPIPTLQDEKAIVAKAITTMRARKYEETIAQLSELLQHNPSHIAALCISAQAQANSGHLDAAEELCRRVMAIDTLVSLPYHLLARIAEEHGNGEEAKAHLKTTIYLNPGGVWSYLELAAIYAREGDVARASQMQRAALEVLSHLPSDAVVPSDEHAIEDSVSVAQLLAQLKSTL